MLFGEVWLCSGQSNMQVRACRVESNGCISVGISGGGGEPVQCACMHAGGCPYVCKGVIHTPRRGRLDADAVAPHAVIRCPVGSLVHSSIHQTPTDDRHPVGSLVHPPPNPPRQMTVGQCFERDSEGEKAEAYPSIRLFTVGTNVSSAPLDDLAAPQQPWTVSSKEVRRVWGGVGWACVGVGGRCRARR